MTISNRPIPNAYWVVPNQLLAGGYPGVSHANDVASALRRLLDSGITTFVDLTVAGEYGAPAYAAMVAQLGATRGVDVSYARFPIVDMGVPDLATIKAILDHIEQQTAMAETIYVHCYGGIGRTGTVVGCYLVSQGMSATDAVDSIARRRFEYLATRSRSPETDDQYRFIEKWESRIKGEQDD